MNKSSIDIIFEHALNTLPDSLAARRNLLGALRNTIQRRHPAYKVVCDLANSLAEHEAAQATLPLDWESKPSANPKSKSTNGHDGSSHH